MLVNIVLVDQISIVPLVAATQFRCSPHGRDYGRRDADSEAVGVSVSVRGAVLGPAVRTEAVD